MISNMYALYVFSPDLDMLIMSRRKVCDNGQYAGLPIIMIMYHQYLQLYAQSVASVCEVSESRHHSQYIF